MNLLGESNIRRRLSIPEINLKNISGSPKKLLSPKDNDYSELNAEEPTISRARLSMDRVHTPELAFDLKPDGAFSNLRPVSPQYIPQYQSYDCMEDKHDSPESDEDNHIGKSANLSRMRKNTALPVKEQPFQLVQSESKSGRYLVKVPIANKNVQKCDDTDELNDTANPRYPTCMLSYKRGVSSTPQMNLVEPDEPSLSSLRAKIKLRISSNIRKNIEIMQLRFAAMAMEPELEQMEREVHNSNEVDLLHIMGDDGKIIWKNIDDSDIEADLGTNIESMPTLDQNKFQNLDPEEILDAFLTDKYIVLETTPPAYQDQ